MQIAASVARSIACGANEEDRDSAGGAGTPNDYEVSYAYAKITGGRNTVRRTQATMPSTKVITYEYLSLNNRLDHDASRLSPWGANPQPALFRLFVTDFMAQFGESRGRKFGRKRGC